MSSWPLYCSYIHLFDKVPEEEEAKYHPLTRFALTALARKNPLLTAMNWSLGLMCLCHLNHSTDELSRTRTSSRSCPRVRRRRACCRPRSGSWWSRGARSRRCSRTPVSRRSSRCSTTSARRRSSSPPTRCTAASDSHTPG